MNISKDNRVVSDTIVLRHEIGLHARPAALLVQTAGRFEAQVNVLHNGRTINAKSILDVLGLGAKQGDNIIFVADGPDAGQALAALEELVVGNFGEE